MAECFQDKSTNEQVCQGVNCKTLALTGYCSIFGVRPQLTFLSIVSHECRVYEIVKWEFNKLILCDMSAFEQEYSQVCLWKLLAVKQCIF